MPSNLAIAGDETLTVQPVANPQPTQTSFSVTANTTSAANREFMANFGLISGTGSPSQNQNDKVTLFSGLDAIAGTSDVWSLYSVLGMTPNSGNYNAQGYELDFNNFNANRGNSGNLNTDFSNVIAIGLSVTGASTFTSTSAFLVSSQSGTDNPQWARGITTVGSMGVCAIQEWSSCPVGLQFDGAYSQAAINTTAVYGNSGAVTNTALLMKNNQGVSWQNNIQTAAVTDVVDSSNNRIVGNGAAGVFVGASLNPLGAGGAFSLGNNINFWGAIFSNVGIVTPSDLTLKSDVEPLPSMSDVVKSVTPISYRWKDGSDVHYGFDADDIRQHFPDDFAGHQTHDGVQYLVKDELISVLWRSNQEMLGRIEDLEALISLHSSRKSAKKSTHSSSSADQPGTTPPSG